MQRVLRFLGLIVGILIFSVIVFAQEQAPDKVEKFFSTSYIFPEAEKNLNRGLDAAKQQDWALAIQYFLEAQKNSPYYGPLLFNLGLANAKAGNDAAACAWFRAYLTAFPEAKNVNEVKAEIENLKESLKDKSDKIYNQLYQMADQIQTNGSEKERAYDYITISLAETGNFEAADQMTKRPERVFPMSWDFKVLYAKTLARLGDFKEALNILQKAQDSSEQKDAYEYILKELLEKGDIVGAWKIMKTTAKFNDLDVVFILKKAQEKKDTVLIEEIRRTAPLTWKIVRELAAQKAEAGDFAEVERLVNSLTYTPDKAEAMINAAVAFWEKKDYKSAKKLANRVLGMAGELGDWGECVAIATGISGDYQKAFALTEKIKLNSFQPDNLSHTFGQLAYLLTVEGNMKLANEAEELSAKQAKGTHRRSLPQYYIAMAYLDLGKLDKAKEKAEQITEEYSDWLSGGVLARIALAQIKAGNPQAAEEALRSAVFVIDLSSAEILITAWKQMIEVFLKQKETEKALEVYEDLIEKSKKGIMEPTHYMARYIRILESLMRDEADIGIQQGYIKKDLAEWIISARLLTISFDFKKELAYAKKLVVSPDWTIKMVADYARGMRLMLLKLEQMEKGNFDGSIAPFIREH